LTRIYLAGPMTGIKDLNFPLFHAAAAALRAEGLDVVNPAEINPDHTMPWEQCMRRDIAQLVTCDEIHMLEGWRASKGADVEYRLAKTLGLTVSGCV